MNPRQHREFAGHFMEALVNETRIDWSRVEVFHLDEYVGMSDASDLEAELIRYSALPGESPIDVAFVGIGENGHI